METHVGSGKQAKALAEAVLLPRLAACANWFPIQSAFWWKGRLVPAGEVRLTLTTGTKRLAALVAAVKEEHPYEVAYIAWGDGLEVPAPYARWAISETTAGQARPRRLQPRAGRRTR